MCRIATMLAIGIRMATSIITIRIIAIAWCSDFAKKTDEVVIINELGTAKGIVLP